MQVINAAGTLGSVKVSGVTENCHNCRLPALCFIPYGQFTNGGTCTPNIGVLVNDADGYLLFDVRHYFNVELFDPDGNRFYKETLNLKEHSTHTLFVAMRGTAMVATLYQDLEGNKIWIPLIIAIFVIIGVAIVYAIVSALWLKKTERDREESARADGHIQVRSSVFLLFLRSSRYVCCVPSSRYPQSPSQVAASWVWTPSAALLFVS